ncbi:hypothetical protein BDW69DRAFT_205203 [Aspergillus filifer]
MSDNRAVDSPLPTDTTISQEPGTPYQLGTIPLRGLPRRRSRYLTRNTKAQAGPVVVPNSYALGPMERWRNSPPEEEPALIPDILNALKTAPAAQRNNAAPRRRSRRSSNAGRSHRQAGSTTSGESYATSQDSQLSAHSSSSAGAHNAVSSTERHEKSLHVTLEAWYCAPFGMVTTAAAPDTTATSSSTADSHSRCAFCNEADPSQEHLDEHSPTACESEQGTRRSFRRKDHLIQHLRHSHGVTTIPADLERWKIGTSAISSRCGFCSAGLSTWEQRVEHLAEHFRTGATMAEPIGQHDFPPQFAALVANALPPYLIASESHSVIPFSATNCDAQDHFAQISSRARWDNPTDQLEIPHVDSMAAHVPTASSSVPSSLPLHTVTPGIVPEQLSSFTQVLTLHLGRFAREQMRKGIIPSDEMFQQESRRVLYDSEDTWNQTIADNPEWLAAFRALHCDG